MKSIWNHAIFTGHSWSRIDPSILPESSYEGEGGFASSGSCIATFEEGIAWIGTGSNGNARILKTTDYGNSWEAFDTPIIKGIFDKCIIRNAFIYRLIDNSKNLKDVAYALLNLLT